MYPAQHSETKDNRRVQCLLCPHKCILSPGDYGKCNTRINHDGQLMTQSYGILSSISSDPIEKKPLYHFYPGRSIFSIGSFGCNLSCDFCQNCEISQITEQVFSRHPVRNPVDIVQKGRMHSNNIGLAYTYNEPTVYFEYMMECAALLKAYDLKNVMVTNGFINREPLDELLTCMDGFNVDLKSFRDEFYQLRSGASLKPVLQAIETIAGSERHLELTFLIIPGYNDQEDEWDDMISWICDHCGPDIVLHVSRYFPRYKLNNPPTPIRTIERFMDVSKGRINYVYPGNSPQLDNNTYCPGCHSLIIERSNYNSNITGISQDGHCLICGYGIYGSFSEQ